MSSIKPKLVRLIGVTIISIVCFVSLSFFLLVVLEFSGAARKIDNSAFNDFSYRALHETNYYGEKLNEDPYAKFSIQHLHPYYIFSLPWMPEDIENANNNFVTIERTGFRTSESTGKNKKAILLGGSTAFGHFSSSDKTTLASLLSKKSEYDFVNRNAPSWNSHQELISLTKYTKPYSISVSLSLTNDISAFCNLRNYEFPIKDRMESFDILSDYFNDIRGSVKKADKRNLFSLKKLILQYFPDSYNVARKLKRSMIADNYSLGDLTPEEASCFEHEDMLVKTFLDNQKIMREISSARGSIHILAIQPLYLLNVNSEQEHNSMYFDNRKSSKKEILFLNNVVKKIMKDPFCNQECIDLSKSFQNFSSESLLYDPIDDNSLETAMFVDSVHLTDKGTEVVVDLIVSFLNQ